MLTWRRARGHSDAGARKRAVRLRRLAGPWPGLAWPGSVRLGLTLLCLALPGFAWAGLGWAGHEEGDVGQALADLALVLRHERLQVSPRPRRSVPVERVSAGTGCKVAGSVSCHCKRGRGQGRRLQSAGPMKYGNYSIWRMSDLPRPRTGQPRRRRPAEPRGRVVRAARRVAAQILFPYVSCV